jgi:hypothetical protein
VDTHAGAATGGAATAADEADATATAERRAIVRTLNHVRTRPDDNSIEQAPVHSLTG